MKEAQKYLESLVGPTTIGLLLRAYRTRNDFTLEDVAKKLGVSKSYVSDLEHDRKNISLAQARDIAEKLGDFVDLYAKVWLENRMSEAGFTGTVEIRPVSKPTRKSSKKRAS